MDNDAKSVLYRLFDDYTTTPTQENFSNAMLNSWITLESYTNRLFLEEYGVATNERTDKNKEKWENTFDTLERISFERKCQFLSKNGVFNSKESKAIADFQYERNRLFHASRKNEVFYKLQDRNEQKRLLGSARTSFDAIWSAVRRYYTKRAGLSSYEDL